MYNLVRKQTEFPFCPSKKILIKKLASELPGTDAISFYGCLDKTGPQIIPTIKLKLPLHSWAPPPLCTRGITEIRIHILFDYTITL